MHLFLHPSFSPYLSLSLLPSHSFPPSLSSPPLSFLLSLSFLATLVSHSGVQYSLCPLLIAWSTLLNKCVFILHSLIFFSSLLFLQPPFIVTLDDVELVHFERVQVFKHFTHLLCTVTLDCNPFCITCLCNTFCPVRLNCG